MSDVNTETAHPASSGAQPGGTIAALQRALDRSEQEKHFYDALCIDYTAAYLCDLMTDEMTPIKRKSFSHGAVETQKTQRNWTFSEWIRYSYEHLMIHESAPDFLEQFDNKALMERLKTQESFVCRHQTRPNSVGMQYFEARVIRLYADEHSYKVILGYRPIDDIIREEQESRRRLEDALHRAEEASRAKSSFLFNMSHDIRTPMNAIIGYTELLENHCDDPAKRVDYIHKIKSSSQYLLALLNDVLEMARIESGKTTLDETQLELHEFDRTLCDVFENQMEQKGIRFAHKLDVQHPSIYCDAVKVKEVLLNILSNAYKYTMPGGQITFTVTEHPGTAPGCAVYRAVVADTGIGMSEAYLASVYDSFSRERTATESGQSGTGLGMAITKSLVELMGGTIQIESRQGRGTTVTVEMQHRIAAEAPAAEQPQSREPVSFAGRTILLAEDNDLNAEIAAEILKADGFTVERARDGVECIAMLENHAAGHYDLILMDIQMPNMDGYRATAQIRGMADKALADIPIVAMTANAFEEDKRRALAVGMNAHIAKPLNIHLLESTLAHLL